MEIPFYFSKRPRCAEAAAQSVLKFYFPKRDFSIRELSHFFERKPTKLVYPVQIANAFIDLGLNVSYFSSFDLENFANSNETDRLKFYEDFYGVHSGKILSGTDFSVLNHSIEKIIKRGYEKNDVSFFDLENYHNSGSLVYCLINNDLFNLQENTFSGHYAVITEIGDEYLKYHEVGPAFPESNKGVNKKRFANALNHMCFFDSGAIVIHGIKSNFNSCNEIE